MMEEDAVNRNEKTILLLVYNADTGLFNSMTDWAHKVIAPSTYRCNLCSLTHGNFGMKKEWKEFIEGLNMELHFFHKDEFNRKYGSRFNSFPCIFVLRKDVLMEVISRDEINNCETMSDLKEKINKLTNRLSYN